MVILSNDSGFASEVDNDVISKVSKVAKAHIEWWVRGDRDKLEPLVLDGASDQIMEWIIAKLTSDFVLPPISDQASYYRLCDLFKVADYLVFEALTQEIISQVENFLLTHSPMKIGRILRNIPEERLLSIEFDELYALNDINITDETTCSNFCCDDDDCSTIKNLKQCTSCRLTYYCSLKCQKEHWKEEHRDDCKEVKKHTRIMQKEAQKLSHISFGIFDNEYENLFETQVGRFYGILESRPYCRARWDLSQALRSIAWNLETRKSWEQVLHHQAELLRLSHGDNLGIRYEFPFTLLQLGKNQQAYAFVKYWLNSETSEDYDFDELPTLEPGQFCQAEDADMHEPFLLSPTEVSHTSMQFLVVILIIELRLEARNRQILERCQAFMEGSDGQNEALEKAVEQRMKQQVNDEATASVNKCLELIFNRNRVLLCAMLDPGPLREQGSPHFIVQDSPMEAVAIINQCVRLVARIPYSHLRIEKFLEGRGGLSYDPTFVY